MKSYLITGGTGFLGKNLLIRFPLNSKLTILSRNPTKFIKRNSLLMKRLNINFIKGDIRNFKFHYNNNFDYIIHAATTSAKQLNNDDEQLSVIVDGTKNLLKQVNIKTKKLLYISSGGVYGIQPNDLSYISENFPCTPTTNYGKGKLEAEKLCLKAGIPTSIARCFTFVGPYLPLDTHFAIGNFILNGIKNEAIIIKGNGKVIRSYMYSEELAEWLLNILMNGRIGEIYNVGSDEQVTISDLAKTVNICFKNKLNIIKLNKKMTGISRKYVPSIQKIKQELGLTTKITLIEGIKKTIKWYNEEYR